MADLWAWITDLFGWLVGRAIGRTLIWVLIGGPVFLLVMLVGPGKVKRDE